MDDQRALGFVRRTAILNLAPGAVELDVVDGIQNVLPDGLTRAFQMEFSTLADAYKESELDPSSGLALFRLSAIPTDRNEPNEALRTTTVWSEGIQPARRLLCSAQLDRYRAGQEPRRRALHPRPAGRVPRRRADRAVGRRAARVERVADVGQDATSVAELIRLLTSDADLRAELEWTSGWAPAT